ncbi:MAG: WG repeat-containing protein [Bacteroidales bacterium]|nr:WG repeat-containing protein [Bacteroidales bacterium]
MKTHKTTLALTKLCLLSYLLFSACSNENRYDGLEKSLRDYRIVSINDEKIYVESRLSQCDPRTGNGFYPAGVLDADGRVLIPVEYEQIAIIQNDVVRARQSGKWGLLDLCGKQLTPFQYDWIDTFQGGYAIVKAGHALGVIRKDGTVVLPVTHESVYRFYPDSFWENREHYNYEAVFYVKDGPRLNVVNLSRQQGERTDSEHIESPYDYQSVKDNGKYGYINYKGDRVVPCKYENARDTFSEGLAAVVWNHKVGFIDKTGSVRIPFVFEYSEFDFNFYQYGLAKFSEDLCAMTSNRKFGYIDKRGETVIPFEYDGAGTFQYGCAVVYKASGNITKAALIDRKGQIIIPFQYDYISIQSGSEPILFVEKDDKWGLCSLQGDVLAACDYDGIPSYFEGLVQMRKNGWQGLIDPNGKIILPFEYESVILDWAKEELFVAKKDGKWGCVDPENNIVIPFDYEEVSFHRLGNQLYCLIVENGEKKLYSQHSRSSSAVSGRESRRKTGFLPAFFWAR